MYDDINYYYGVLANCNKTINEIGELGKALMKINYKFPMILNDAEAQVYDIILKYALAESRRKFALDKIEMLTNLQYDTNFDVVDDVHSDESNF